MAHVKGGRRRGTGVATPLVPWIAQIAFSCALEVNPETRPGRVVLTLPMRELCDRSATEMVAMQGGISRIPQIEQRWSWVRPALLWFLLGGGIALAASSV